MSMFNFNGMSMPGGGVSYQPVKGVSEVTPPSPAGSQPQGTPSGEPQSGQVLSGEVVEVKDGSVTLKLSDNQLLNARLDSSVHIDEGQSMSFEVRNDGKQVELRPLYANLSPSPAASQALEQAGLPKTPANINMAGAMMEEGMPINREALRSMAKEVAMNPTADPATVVQLAKLELPVNPNNIQQLENYKNFEHQIVGDADHLSDGLSELLGEVSETVSKEVLSLASGEGDSELSALVSGLRSPEGESSETLNNSAVLGDPAAAKDASEISGEPAKLVFTDDEEGAAVKNAEVGQEKAAGLTEQNAAQETRNAGADFLAKLGNESEDQAEAAVIKDQAATIKGAENESAKVNPGGQELPSYDSVLKDIAGKLEESGMPKETVSLLSSGQMSQEEMVNLVDQLYSRLASGELKYDPLKQDLEKLLKDKDFKGLVKDVLMKKMTLEPKDVADEKKIEELYKRLNEQSDKAIELLTRAGKTDSQALQSAQNIKSNMQFMNDLNQMMQYVQLPLKMAQENTHGDLYVYTKNKKQIGKNGAVSALLHLDMETLGPMDVYVAMQQNRVNTHFYLQDEETLDFIIAHVDQLDQRLKERGYDMHTTVTTKDIREDKGIVDEFLKTASTEGAVSAKVSKYSFDVRA